MRIVSTSVPHLVSVLRDQVVIPELAEEGVRVLHAGHFCFLTVEKLQQLRRLQEVQRIHRPSVRPLHPASLQKAPGPERPQPLQMLIDVTLRLWH